MPATTKVPLGADTTARKWYLDVNTGTNASPTWVGVFGLLDFKAPVAADVKDDSDYDSGGYKSSTVTALGWTVEFKVARKVQASVATAYDPGQEVLRLASVNMGASNRVEVRWYEMEASGPRVEAYQGYAAVSWAEDGGAMDALATVTIKLDGQGARTAITHPDAASVPHVFSVTPAAAGTAGGTLVDIIGSGFLGLTAAAAVKLAAANATSYVVIDDNHIAAICPANAAGAKQVIVTNGTGPSVEAVTVTYS